VAAPTPNLTAGQFYNVLFGVQDTGGGSSLGASINGNQLNPSVQTGQFSYISDNGAGSNFQIDSGAELKVKTFDGVTSVKLANNATLTFSNKASQASSNADRIQLTGSNGNVFLGDKNVVTVGELVLGSAGTLNIDQAVGASTGGRLVVSGNVTGFTGVATDITGGTINVVGGTLIANTQINGAGIVSASLLGTIGGTGSINMPINVFGSAILSPGDPASNGGIGRLNVGALTMDGNLSLNLLDAGTTPNPHYDQVGVTGIVDINNTTLSLTLAPGFTANPGDVFKILLNDSTDGVFGQFAQGTSITVGAAQFNIVYNGDYDGSGAPNDIGLIFVVPEPGTLAIMLGGFATLVGLRRTRRRN